jgi:hypothetical protein
MTDQTRTCGSCTYCCKVVAVTELGKPPGVWCGHCAIGTGCKIYADRPEGCQAFECFWLQSGAFGEGLYRMPDEMRPDKIKVVFGGTAGGHKCMVYVDPATPDAWRTNRLAAEFIERMRKAYSVVVVCGDRRKFLPAYTAEGQRDMERLIQLGGSR